MTEQSEAADGVKRRVVVALDDDPTGVQTVYDTPVLTVWDIETLAGEFHQQVDGHAHPVFFILTNSRSLPAADAATMNTEIVGNLRAAADLVNRDRPAGHAVDFVIASRSDSTLRGHFPAETDAIATALGGVDGLLLVPAFFEGGRTTSGDVHYVREGDRQVPAAETEFALDKTFGYHHSNLRDWVEEKTGRVIAAADVRSLSLDLIRNGGAAAVRQTLNNLTDGAVIVVNAENYDDLAIVAQGVEAAEAGGKRFIYRTAASFVRARAGLDARPLLTRSELLGTDAAATTPGLVVVGSHVRKSSEQLAHLLDLEGVSGIELHVSEILTGGNDASAEIGRVRDAADSALRDGRTPVVYTSRELATHAAGGEGQLAVSQAVSAALVNVVTSLHEQPGFVVGKGGITSSDIGTKALGARRAIVLGQIKPGIPVWRLGSETRFPGLPYVVFPGNVGGPETLADIVQLMQGNQD